MRAGSHGSRFAQATAVDERAAGIRVPCGASEPRRIERRHGLSERVPMGVGSRADSDLIIPPWILCV
jgi:hypothetical protein